MTPSMVRDQRALDLMVSDRLPSCPDCGDLAHPAATACEGCGSHLFPAAPARPARPEPACGCDACEEIL